MYLYLGKYIMTLWLEPITYGAALVFFVLGVSSIVTSFMLPTTDERVRMKEKVEYRFFGISGLIGFALMLYAIL